jgi:Flp pilus assembly pilin Flp
MHKQLTHMWQAEDGVLSFEWTLLVTLLTFGVVSGLAGARDAIIDEFGDAAQAMLALDQSMTIDFPLEVVVHTGPSSSGSDSAFTDAAIYTDCSRIDGTSGTPDQGPDVTDDQDS